MGGDLNLKKSWHPSILSNQKKVWQEEKNALEERKQIEKLRREREEERAMEELQKLQEASGGKVIQKRVDWMYSGPGTTGDMVTEEREGYLLGKRRVDALLKGNENTAQLTKNAAASIDTAGPSNANSARDIQSKVAQDPLLLIQKQKMEAQVKLLREAQQKAKYDEKRLKEKERERKHKHRHSRRDRSRSRDSSDERDRRHRHRHRSRSRDRYEDRERKHRHYRRERSRSRHSSDDRDRRHKYRSRSRSPYRRERDDRADRDSHRRRSRSPRRFSPRPPRRDDRERERNYNRDDRPFQRAPPPKPEEKPEPTESAADKLAKMQADANALEEQRIQRVKMIEAQDAAEVEKHMKNKDGGRKFITGVRGKAMDSMDLGDVMARGRHALVRDE